MGERNRRVFSLLKEQKKTKALMAKALNISRSAVTQWEQNGTEPTYEQCIVLANFFSVPLNEIYPGAETSDSATNEPDPEPLQQPQIDMILLREFNKLNDYGKRVALRHIKEMQQLTLYVAAEKEMVIAAHNDAEMTPQERALMEMDLEEI